MGKVKIVLQTCMWACMMACVNSVKMENGIYKDLVVALDPLMAMDTLDMMQLQQKLTGMMNDMSDAMMTATKDRLSVGSVRVVLPHWWNNTDSLSVFPAEEGFSWVSADIRMQKPPENPFGGYEAHAPNTLQMGQCGVPGRHITVHTSMLDDGYSEANYGPRGHVLIHEWAHYRWGIFDEYGHPHDPKYPVSYEDEGFREVSACYGGELSGEYLTMSEGDCPGDPNDSKNPCYFFPNASSSPITTMSSLMSHTFLSDGHFCTNETHNARAPTPQNFMCGQRSVWEVLNAHPDFHALGSASRNPPTVTFHKAPMTRIFVLFDEPPKEVISSLRSNVKQGIDYFTKLYGKVEIGMATFSSTENGTVEIYNNLEFMPISNFSSVEDYVPKDGINASVSEIQLGKALIELLPAWERHEPGTVVVAVIYNALSQDNPEEELITRMRNIGVKLLLISPKGGLSAVLPMIHILQNTGGNFYVEDQSKYSATERLAEDVDKYLESHTIDDHKMYGVSYIEVEASSSATLPKAIVENRGLAKQLNGYLQIIPFKDSDLIDINLEITDTDLIACNDINASVMLYCEYTNDGLFFYLYTPTGYSVVREYFVKILNQGNEKILVKGTWSMVEEDANNPHMWLNVWSSEEFGLKADVQEANSLFLYCQVSNSLGIVQNVEVMAEVEFIYEGNKSTQVITLSDVGDGVVDVKAKDTVWSGKLAGEWTSGTTLTVTTLAVNHNPDVFSPFHQIASSVSNKLSSGSGSSGWQEARASGSSSSSSSSSVLTKDPRDADCLSYSSGSSLSRSYVLNQMLLLPYTFTFISNLTNVPPPPQNVINDPTHPPYISDDTVKVTIKIGGMGISRRTRSTVYQYWTRYHPDVVTLQDNFTSAKMPLDGSDAPITSTSIIVTLPYDNTVDVFIAVAVADMVSNVVGPPSHPIKVEMTGLIVSTTPTTSTSTTITTTKVMTTFTPKPTSSSPSTVSTSFSPAVTTTTAWASFFPTTTITTAITAPEETSDSTVVIVVSVVCAVVAVGVAGGLFYYFKYYKIKNV